MLARIMSDATTRPRTGGGEMKRSQYEPYGDEIPPDVKWMLRGLAAVMIITLLGFLVSGFLFVRWVAGLVAA